MRWFCWLQVRSTLPLLSVISDVRAPAQPRQEPATAATTMRSSLAVFALFICVSEALVLPSSGVRLPRARLMSAFGMEMKMMGSDDHHRTPAAAASALAAALLITATPAFADGGATAVENSKIMNGGASTIVNQRGARKTITRGVQLDKANFAGEDLTGVSFQQSQVRSSPAS